jgi:lipid-A-disaccharide synthase
LDSARSIIALLPGSRKQEISRMLAMMLKSVERFPDYQFVVAGAPSLEASFYEDYLKEFPSVKLVFSQTYDLLCHARAALVTSGTATLETALFGVPQVVCYKAGKLSYRLAKWLINKDLKYISIVNLIAEKEVVRELIQDDFTFSNLCETLSTLLASENLEKLKGDYEAIKRSLGGMEGAKLAANEIYGRLKGIKSP